ncbi:MAG: hypothetical protein SVZ03_01320 [Spirochaetota bacterium]|nr:hypothetical protein [Spirochaetota bacterium]
MNKSFLILIGIFILACNDIEFEYYQPANPPVGIEISKSDNDYILVFRSENTTNQRFGGFFIFIDSNINELKRITDELQDIDFVNMTDSERFIYTELYKEMAPYILGSLVGDNSDEYNLGMDSSIEILFSDVEDEGRDVKTNTITKSFSMDSIVPGSWLTLVSYLVDENNLLAGVSMRGEIVEIIL